MYTSRVTITTITIIINKREVDRGEERKKVNIIRDFCHRSAVYYNFLLVWCLVLCLFADKSPRRVKIVCSRPAGGKYRDDNKIKVRSGHKNGRRGILRGEKKKIMVKRRRKTSVDRKRSVTVWNSLDVDYERGCVLRLSSNFAWMSFRM